MNTASRFQIGHAFALLVAILGLAVSAHPALADTPRFQFQGRVRDGVTPVNGTGYMEFALLHKTDAETVYLWTNSDGPSTTEPDASVALPVDNGYFSAGIGDTDVAGMAALSPTYFNDSSPLYLRVWFSATPDGPLERLEPDFRLSALGHLGKDGTTTTTLYVDSVAGNDLNSGLLPNSPKKSLGAAVKLVPKSLVADYTVLVAPGLYPESVKVVGVHCVVPHKLRIYGETSWAPQAGSAPSPIPSVKISGYAAGSSGPRVRVPFTIENCAGVHVSGFSLIGSDGNGMYVDRTTNSDIDRCAFVDANYSGLYVTDSVCGVRDAYATRNGNAGLNFIASNVNLGYVGSGGLTRCSSNAKVGVSIVNRSVIQWGGTGQIDHNINGIGMTNFCSLIFLSPAEESYSTYSGSVTSNNGYGIVVDNFSYVKGFDRNTVTGNTNGSSLVRFGSTMY